MTSDEPISSSLSDLREYTSSWSEQGYDSDVILEHFNNNLGLSEIEEIESRIHHCELLKKRIALTSEQKAYSKRLSNPFNSEEVEHEFIGWASTNMPWEVACFRYHYLWAITPETEAKYWDLLQKFTSFDESSWPAIHLLTPFLSEPDSYDNLVREVTKIEESEKRQRKMLNEALLILREKGLHIKEPTGNLINQLSIIERYQALSDRREYILLEIENSIEPFDMILSETLSKKAHDIDIEDREEMEKMQKNIQTIGQHLKERLFEMNTLLTTWNNLGCTYKSTTRINASELLEWEHMLPEVEQSFNLHSTAMARWEEISKSWDLADSEINNIVGKLEHTETFLEKIEELEQEWTNIELQTASIVEHWEQFGFDLDVWRYKAAEEPRSALSELNAYIPKLEKASELMNLFFNLDTSLGGEDEVGRRTILLQTTDLDSDLLSEMEDWIEKRTLRNTRHRRMLEREWRQAIGEGKTASEPNFTDLHSFEQAVASFDRQGQNHRFENSSSRIINNAKHELISLESQGWNVGELLALTDDSPEEFIRLFSSTRAVMSNISKIQRRLSALDWRRDVTRASEISEMVRNPLSLIGIEAQIPTLIRHLSSRPIEDEDFTYSLWMPIQRPVLLPQADAQRPIKKPEKIQPQTTLEEAQEAILEAMEEQIESDMIVDDEEVVDVKKDNLPKNDVSLAKEKVEENIVHEPTQQPEHKESKTEQDQNSRLLHSFQAIMKRLSLSESLVFNAQGTLDTKLLRRTLAGHVGITPRDVRVDRMMRILLRLLPSEDMLDDLRSVLVDKIEKVLPKYEQWIRMRLEARHSGATGNFLKDSIELGAALHRTPGPGVKVPLVADTLPLPDSSNLEEMEKCVDRLVEALDLNASGGVN